MKVPPETAVFMYCGATLPRCVGARGVCARRVRPPRAPPRRLTASLPAPRNPNSSTTVIQELYTNHKDIDGFLYLTFTGESAFGCE